MPTCRNCGKTLSDDMLECPRCGVLQNAEPQQAPEPETVREEAAPQRPVYAEPVQPQQPQVVDNGGFGWGLLGCCVPLVGLILFLVWKDTKPKTAKAAGIGALVYVACMVVYLLMIVLGGALFGFLA